MNTSKYPYVLMLFLLSLNACTGTGEISQNESVGEAAYSNANNAQGGNNQETSTIAYPDAESLAATEIQNIDENGNATGGVFDDPRSPLSKQTIYFEYDSSQIMKEYIPVINAHAGYLIAHPQQRMALQGHADERGTREYNIALAEQRSKSVARIMQMQGVVLSQLDIVSYGEEKPATSGHSREVWQKNRRVELMYLK